MKINITQDDITTALRVFLMSLFDCEIITANDNNVAMPVGQFIVMSPLFSASTSTSIVNYSVTSRAGEGEQHIKRSIKWTCQLDFYGQLASDMANTVFAVWPTEYACSLLRFNGGVLSPLYCSEPRNVTMINAEKNYETRWAIDVTGQINPTVTTPMLFFNNVCLKLKNVESI